MNLSTSVSWFFSLLTSGFPAHPRTKARGGSRGSQFVPFDLNRICFEDTENLNKYNPFIGPKCHLFRENFHDLYLEIFG